MQSLALAQEKEEQQKTLKRLTKALVPSVGDEDDMVEDSYRIDIEETERAMEELAKEVAEQNKPKERLLTKALVPSVGDDEIDEELRRMREELSQSYNDLERELTKPLPASLMYSARSSPNINTSTV